jgi:hypothetical protein
MFADAAFRCLPGGLAHCRIRNQESQAICQVRSITAPEGEACVGHGLPIFGDVTAEHAQSGSHRIQQCQGQALQIGRQNKQHGIHTVKKYLFRIFDKLGISSRVELVLYAVNHGDPLPAEWLAGVSQTTPAA